MHDICYDIDVFYHKLCFEIDVMQGAVCYENDVMQDDMCNQNDCSGQHQGLWQSLNAINLDVALI
jgi:hypothetical protein